MILDTYTSQITITKDGQDCDNPSVSSGENLGDGGLWVHYIDLYCLPVFTIIVVSSYADR